MGCKKVVKEYYKFSEKSVVLTTFERFKLSARLNLIALKQK